MHTQPDAFDAFAAGYDDDFSHTWLGRTLRQRVWDILEATFAANDELLELAGGTGIDAAWLAERGHRVVYSDGSPAMVEQARRRLAESDHANQVECRCLSLQEIAAGALGARARFDGVLSNFGGLNTIGDWRPLAAALAGLVRPGGRLVLVPMGPVCPWEAAWFAGHGDWSNARRRQRQPAAALIGGATIPIWYPSLGRLKHDLAPLFRLRAARSLGLWLPPSYLAPLLAQRRRLRAALAWLDRVSAPIAGGWGDHYIAVFERAADA